MMLDCTWNIHCMLCYDLVSFMSGISLNNSMLSLEFSAATPVQYANHFHGLYGTYIKLNMAEKTKVYQALGSI